MADAHERLGHHVQEEAAQELAGPEGHLTGLATVSIAFPAEGDTLAIKFQQAMIGNGHAGCNGPDSATLASDHQSWLSTDDPVLAVQAAKELRELLGIGKRSGSASCRSGGMVTPEGAGQASVQ